MRNLGSRPSRQKKKIQATLNADCPLDGIDYDLVEAAS